MEWIQNWSNVTHMNPGRRGNVYIGKFNGKRKYKQKRFLLWVLGNLFDGIIGKVNNQKSSVIFFRSICLSPSYIITWKAINITFLKEIFPMALVGAKYVKMLCWWRKVLVKNDMKDVSKNLRDIVKRVFVWHWLLIFFPAE